MKDSLVSVIIPTYARPVFLSRAIKSVLNQTYSNLEILVVDDNNPETHFRKETEILMQSFKKEPKIKYIQHEKNKNGSAARNTGIKNALGEYIAFLDDDDEFLPTKIEKQLLKLYELDESWGGCYCNYTIVDKKKVIAVKKTFEEGNLTDSLLLMRNSIASGSTLLIRKSVLTELRGYDESFTRHQDWEFMIRFFKIYKIAIVSEDLVKVNFDSRINLPDSGKFVHNKERFLKLFKNSIEHSPNSKQIYHNHYLEIVYYCAERKELGYVFKYLRVVRNYKKLNFKEYLRILYLFMNVRKVYLPVVVYFNKVKNG